LKCPACHGVLNPIAIAGVTVDVCQNGCAGAWFDQGELRKVAPSEAAEQVLAGIAFPATVRVDLNARRKCPRCPTSVLMRHFFSPARAVTIDECPTCAGIWLDSGEFDRIQSEDTSPEARSRAVRALFEAGAIDERMELIRQQLPPDLPYDNRWSRIMSSLIVVFYLVAVSELSMVWPVSLLTLAFRLLTRSSFGEAWRVLAFCVLPLCCVWFPEALGGMAGDRGRSPRSCVFLLGWIVLLLPGIMAGILFAGGVRRISLR
jgi:Zn-finger nucleic acid-binding protein